MMQIPKIKILRILKTLRMKMLKIKTLRLMKSGLTFSILRMRILKSMTLKTRIKKALRRAIRKPNISRKSPWKRSSITRPH